MSSSVGRNSLIMGVGTAASRVTGQVRTILLAAAIGTTGMAANAYQAGSMIPQVLYTLVSGGIFNAVLVPQIVRTLKQKNAKDRLNKLITFAIVLLLVVTVLMAIATPLLTRLYVNGSADMMALTNAFTLWCMPQIFFYGLYTVIGQVLAALDHFGAYAWSSVGANLISCAGFTLFIVLFGRADQQPLDFWTTDKIALTAGTWTLGVAFQALILFIPLIRSGFKYRPSWGIHGIGLRTMGPVAAWSVGVVVINQISNIINTRVTTSAPNQASLLYGLSEYDVAGNATYQNAYTLFMLPYSLIAVSVSTAMFPRISQAIADHQIDEARNQLSSALRNVGLMMFFFSVAFIVIPVPITLTVLPSISIKEAILIAGPLMGLGCGLPLSAAYLIIQRTFYAFEDGKHPFIFSAMSSGIQICFVLIATAILSPQYWVTALGAAIPLGNLLSFPALIWMLRKRFDGHIDGRHLAQTYGKGLLAAIVAIVVGLLTINPIYSLVGATLTSDGGSMNWLQAFTSCVLSVIILLIVYVGMLWILRAEELTSAVKLVARYLHRSREAKGAKQAVEATESQAEGAAATSGIAVAGKNEIAPANASAVSVADNSATATVDRNLADTAADVGSASNASNADSTDSANSVGSADNAGSADNMAHANSRITHADNASNVIGDGIGDNINSVDINGVASVNAAATGSSPRLVAHSGEAITQAAENASHTTSPMARMTAGRTPSMPVPMEVEGTMKPQLGDTVLNRYVLVASLRQEPGIQAWKANDRALARDCQLFIINDSNALKHVNATASNLATSHDSHCTRVLQLRHEGDVAIIVTQLDAGLSLADYLRGPAHDILTYDAIRSIMGETVEAAITLRRELLDHRALSLETIRVSSSGIQFADTPISSMLAEPVALPANMSAERRTVCQLAAVLYALLTRTFPEPDAEFDLSALPSDTPSEFYVICSRGLYRQTEDKQHLPMESLSEFSALLGDWTPLNKLSEHDIALPGTDGECSIAMVPIAPADKNAILDIPDSVSSSAVANQFSFSLFSNSSNDSVKTDEQADNSGAQRLANMAAGAGAGAAGAAGAAAAAGAAGTAQAATQAAAQAAEASDAAVDVAANVAGKTGAVVANAANAAKAADNIAGNVGSADSAANAGATGNAGNAGNAGNDSGQAGSADSHSGHAHSGALRSLLHTSKEMLNEGIDDGRAGEDDQSGFFDPFTDQPGALDDSMQTSPINLAPVRLGTGTGVDTTDSSNKLEQTSRIPVVGDDGSIIEPGAESQRALEEEQAAIAEAEKAGTATGTPTPPSFNPEQSNSQNAEQNVNDKGSSVADQPLLGRITTKTVAIIVVILLVVAMLGLALHSLFGDSFGSDDSSQEEQAWPEIDMDSVPFGDSETADDESTDSTSDDQDSADSSDSDADADSDADSDSDSDSDDTDDSDDTSDETDADDEDNADDSDDTEEETYEVITADKEASAIPTPIHTNTTPYQISSQTFLQSPGGQDGFAYVIRLSEAEDIYRMTISITTSGGQGYILVGTSNDPTAGDQVAQFTFAEGGTTTVTFDEVVNTDTVMLWIPRDDLPDGQIYVNQIQLS